MKTYTQIAANLRAEIREDWCDKIEAADDLLRLLKDILPFVEMAFRHEGDVFGNSHNSAVDAMSEAEILITKLSS